MEENTSIIGINAASDVEGNDLQDFDLTARLLEHVGRLSIEDMEDVVIDVSVALVCPNLWKETGMGFLYDLYTYAWRTIIGPVHPEDLSVDLFKAASFDVEGLLKFFATAPLDSMFELLHVFTEKYGDVLTSGSEDPEHFTKEDSSMRPLEDAVLDVSLGVPSVFLLRKLLQEVDYAQAHARDHDLPELAHDKTSRLELERFRRVNDFRNALDFETLLSADGKTADDTSGFLESLVAILIPAILLANDYAAPLDSYDEKIQEAVGEVYPFFLENFPL